MLNPLTESIACFFILLSYFIGCADYPLGDSGRTAELFLEELRSNREERRRDLGQIGILGGNWHFRKGVIFFRWDLQYSLYKK